VNSDREHSSITPENADFPSGQHSVWSMELLPNPWQLLMNSLVIKYTRTKERGVESAGMRNERKRSGRAIGLTAPGLLFHARR
jgi:hypothetical protein